MDSEPTRTDGQGAGPGLPVCLHACIPAASGSARLRFDFAPFHPNEERAGVRGPGLCPGSAGTSCVIFVLIFASLAPVHSSIKQGLQ